MQESLDIDWSSEVDRFILERYKRLDESGVKLRPLFIDLKRKFDLSGLRVTIVYSMPVSLSGSKFAAADEDSAEAAKLVGGALKRRGLKVDYLGLTKENIKAIEKISGDVIVNLCEWTGVDNPLTMKVFDSLEKCGLPFTGTGRQGWSNTVDKAVMKKLFKKSGVTIPGSKVFPMIVKPAKEHCSIGIGQDSIAKNKKELEKIAKLKKHQFGEVVVEEFIDGPELQVTLLECAGKITVLPPAEISYKAGRKDWPLLSFEVRWDEKIRDQDDPSEHVFVPVLPVGLLRQIETDGRQAFKVCNLSGYARMDVRVRNDKAYILEINSNPGLGDHYSYGMTLSQWAVGMSFSDLCMQIIDSALRKFGKLV